METIIASPISFCGGVRHAVEEARRLSQRYPKVYMLFAPVHNEEVVSSLKKDGLVLLEGAAALDLIPEAQDGLLLFGAHGHPLAYEEKAIEEGVEFVDLTCPYVRRILEALREESQNHDIIYLGEEGHQECLASLSISKRIFLYKEGTTNKLPIKDQSPIFRCQTTMSLEEIEKARREILSVFPNAIDRAAPCPATQARQELSRHLPKNIRSAVVLGSATSRNTLSLYEAVKKENPDLFVIRALDEKEIGPYADELRQHAPVYLMSGASSAPETIKRVREYLESL